MKKSNARARPAYSEGDVFALPIDDLGWTIGLIARGRQRTRGETTLFLYIFDHVSSSRPTSCEERFVLEDSVASFRCGSLGFSAGKWLVIGRIEPFDRAKWPLPNMISAVGSLTGARLVTCDEDDLDGQPLRMKLINEASFRGPRYLLHGYVSAQAAARQAILATRNGECVKGEYGWHIPKPR